MIMNKQEMKSKIGVGTATVYLILTVSLAATMAYWYVLSGIESARNLSNFWQIIIWLVVGVGLVAEIIKKVTLSTFRNKHIWLTATFISVVTVMGTYSILDSNRENDLKKQSDSYQMAKQRAENNTVVADKYAYAAGYDLASLEAQLDQVIVDRDNRKIKYNTYLKRKQALQDKINAKRAYDSANNGANSATGAMTNGGATSGYSSNPLLSNVAGFTGVSSALIKSIFYLLVTLLLEIAAFWIGGKVEELKQRLKHTEAELLDMKVQQTFGYSLKDINHQVYGQVVKAQQDEIEAEDEIDNLRKTRKDKKTGEHMESPVVAESVKQKRRDINDDQVQAKQHDPDEYLQKKETVNHSPSIGFDTSRTSSQKVKLANKPLDNSGKIVDLVDDETAQYVTCRNCGKHAKDTVGANGFCSSKCESKSTSPLSTSERQNELDLGGKRDVSNLTKRDENVTAKRDRKKPDAKRDATRATKGLTSGLKPDAVTTSSEGVQNVTEKNVTKPDTKRDVSNVTDAEEKGEVISGATSLYPAWLKTVKNDHSLMVITVSKKWVSAKNKSGEIDIKKFKEKYCQPIVNAMFEMAVSDGVMKRNPDWKQGRKVTKYLFV